jgi:hypothetical protein
MIKLLVVYLCKKHGFANRFFNLIKAGIQRQNGRLSMNVRDYLPIPDLLKCKSLLCIQPHPDDNEVGAGATIAKLARSGCKVTYLTVTDGSKGTDDPGMSTSELAKIRRRETEDAAGLLGVSSLRFLDFEDGSYPESLNSIPEAARISTCPISHQPYTYDPSTGQVHCTFQGHEGF